MVDTWSAEFSRLCANPVLAQRISSMNSYSMICEGLGTDVRIVSQALNLDHQIGAEMLDASVGFGGSCFQKDVAHLVYLASSLGLGRLARYWKGVLDMNGAQMCRFADRIAKLLAPMSNTHTTVAILGFAFKEGTNDSRNSPATTVVNELRARGFTLRIYDPWVAIVETEAAILTVVPSYLISADDAVVVCSSAYEACEGARAVAILTGWDEFRYNRPETAKSSMLASSDGGSVDSKSRVCWDRVATLMSEPKCIFDGRNTIADEVAISSFKVERVGKGSFEC